MHKKQGLVFASLTEVKNKTGDIFAVVDQYGEINITSYNKIRYKIVKVDIDTMIGDEPVKTRKARTVKKVVDAIASKPEQAEVEVKQEHKVEAPKAVVEEPKVEEKRPEPEPAKKTINVDPWHRDSQTEKDFVSKAMAPLVV